MTSNDLYICWLSEHSYSIACRDCYFQHRENPVLPEESAFEFARRDLRQPANAGSATANSLSSV